MADGKGEGTIPVFEGVDVICSASDLVTVGLNGASSPDNTVVLRILSLLYDRGMEDPQKLADAAFLLASSKLFTGML